MELDNITMHNVVAAPLLATSTLSPLLTPPCCPGHAIHIFLQGLCPRHVSTSILSKHTFYAYAMVATMPTFLRAILKSLHLEFGFTTKSAWTWWARL